MHLPVTRELTAFKRASSMPLHPRFRQLCVQPLWALGSTAFILTSLVFIRPAETALSEFAWVSTLDADGYVNVRSRPSSYYSKIEARADRGTKLEVIRRETASDGYYWYQVRSQQTGSGNVTGWVRGDLVSFSAPITTPQREANRCANTLQKIETRLDAVAGVTLESSRQQAHEFQDGPQARAMVQIFSFSGEGRTELMYSTVMLNRMAGEAIAHCPDLAAVRFSAHRTDWYQDYGLLPGALVRGFVCDSDYGEKSPPRWGEMICL